MRRRLLRCKEETGEIVEKSEGQIRPLSLVLWHKNVSGIYDIDVY